MTIYRSFHRRWHNSLPVGDSHRVPWQWKIDVVHPRMVKIVGYSVIDARFKNGTNIDSKMKVDTV